MLSVIGTGTYGKVLLVKKKESNDHSSNQKQQGDQKLFAMKIIKKQSLI